MNESSVPPGHAAVPGKYQPGTKYNRTLDWNALLGFAKEKEATDILFSNGRVFMRLGRDVLPYEAPVLTTEQYKDDVLSLLPGLRHFDELNGPDGATDFAVTIAERRLRVNVYQDSTGLNAALRPLPDKVFAAEKLGLSSKIMQVVVTNKQGLIIVAGPTGSGKSSTISALIEHINVTFPYNIITIEDPVEFMYTPAKSVIQQREVGDHVVSFDRALRSAMRQNPDVIVVGEIRDYATVKAAMQAAETGHLVFATLHTKRVFTTVSRIIEMAPGNEKGELRSVLANNLIMIMCQRLLKRSGGGIIACREIYLQNHAGSNAIRSEREKELNNIMLTKRSEGQIDWDTALNELVKGGHVAAAEAARYRDEVQATT